MVAALSAGVELGQLRIPGRSTSPFDLGLNTAGEAAAAWVSLVAVGRGIAPRRIVEVAGVVVLSGVLLFLVATSFAASRGLGIQDWNSDYPVLVGDEWDGDRAFRGEVEAARICAFHPDEGEVCGFRTRRTKNGSPWFPPRSAEGPWRLPLNFVPPVSRRDRLAE